MPANQIIGIMVKNIIVISSLILVAAASRLLPHPPNFTALGALALFGGFALNHSAQRYLITFGALIVSDLVLNLTVYSGGDFVLFYPGMIWVYGAFGMIVFAGSRIKRNSIRTVVGGSLISAILFFLMSNFGVWLSGTLYSSDLSGLMVCYTAALPYFANTLLSTLLFGGLLFGAHALLERNMVLTPNIEKIS